MTRANAEAGTRGVFSDVGSSGSYPSLSEDYEEEGQEQRRGDWQFGVYVKERSKKWTPAGLFRSQRTEVPRLRTGTKGRTGLGNLRQQSRVGQETVLVPKQRNKERKQLRAGTKGRTGPGNLRQQSRVEQETVLVPK